MYFKAAHELHWGLVAKETRDWKYSFQIKPHCQIEQRQCIFMKKVEKKYPGFPMTLNSNFHLKRTLEIALNGP